MDRLRLAILAEKRVLSPSFHFLKRGKTFERMLPYMTYSNKKCETCETVLHNVHHAVKYCDQCREKAIKKSTKKYKKRVRKEISSEIKKQLIKNFDDVVSLPHHLTPLGFKEVSDISYHSYKNTFKRSWVETIKAFGKYDELIEYIVSEYKDFIDDTGNQSFRYFADSHPYIGTEFLKTIGYDLIRDKLGLRKMRNDKDRCRQEFNRIVDYLGYVPLYSEFLKETRINIKSYQYHLNLTNKNIYDQIVKTFTDESTYDDYLERKQSHKTQTGKENHQGYKYSLQDLKDNLINVFNEYYESHDAYPSLHLFDKISPIDTSVYRKRFNKKWKDICAECGFDIERELYKSEKIALGIVSEILGEDYEPQKTFDWLIGFKGFPLFCDGYFPKYNLIIEFDGDQHRYPTEWFGGMEAFHERKTNDKYKEVLIPRNGYILMRISSEEPFWDKEHIKRKLSKHIAFNNAI